MHEHVRDAPKDVEQKRGVSEASDRGSTGDPAERSVMAPNTQPRAGRVAALVGELLSFSRSDGDQFG